MSLVFRGGWSGDFQKKHFVFGRFERFIYGQQTFLMSVRGVDGRGNPRKKANRGLPLPTRNGVSAQDVKLVTL